MAAIALMPILDIGTDNFAVIDFFLRGYYGWSGTTLAILALNWRFSMLYGVLHPRPTIGTVPLHNHSRLLTQQ